MSEFLMSEDVEMLPCTICGTRWAADMMNDAHECIVCRHGVAVVCDVCGDTVVIGETFSGHACENETGS